MVEKNNFKNLYEVKKTIRFELKPSEKKSFKAGDIIKLQKDFEEVENFFLDIFIDNFTQGSKEENGKTISWYAKLEFKKKREIKYQWLRTYTKNEFYSWGGKSDREKKYALNKIVFLEKEILRWINEWQELTKDLKELKQTEEHKQKRKSDIAVVLRKFLKRQNFSFIKDFFNSVVDIQGEQGNESDEKIRKFREELKVMEKNLDTCVKEYLPSQSNGVLLHKASLNYFTLNKTPKEYEELRQKKEAELNTKIIDCRKEGGKPEFWFDRKFKFGENPLYWTLDESYQKMKIWKAEQKSSFIEAVAGDRLTTENFRENFPLFDATDENFEIFYSLTKKLDEKPENGKEFAQKRGVFFNAPKERIQTQNYFEFCELYKRIAMKRGKIIAEIKGIENEEVQSQLLTHWAVIKEEGEKKCIVFIPREKNKELENHKKVHEFLQNLQKKNQVKKELDDIKIYHFKSLTLKALEKLCFKEIDNTFAPELKKAGLKIEFQRKESGKINQELTEDQLIKFYQQVLQYQYSQSYLDLVDFGDLQNVLDKNDFKNLQEFESELEKVCYVKVPIYFSKEEFKDFTDKFNAEVFEITTRSISSESKRKENVHAKIWKDFWSEKNEENHHITRLNPQVSVFYRDEIKKKSNTSRENKTRDVDNRFSAPRFTLATTITLNTDKKKTNLAFKTVEDIKKHIDGFNEKFNENFSGEWVYGIDRGLKELATLNVVKFSDEKNEFEEPLVKEFAKIPVYKLKDEKQILKDKNGKDLKNAKGKSRKVIDNISEFIEEGKELDPIFFEKTEVSSIDLTQAKLIKGYIILNGDQKTYLKLKEIAAKRRIFELFSSSKIDKNSGIKYKKGGTICIGGKQVYWYTPKQKESMEEKESIKKILEAYLTRVDSVNKFEDIETVEKKINHLRDAITANMVGILFHLQTTLGMKGIIALENLDTVREQTGKKMIDEHFETSNEDISRRLEWALYRKFANSGEVPPQIKETIFLRDEFKVCQMGILKFVEVSGTSRECPNCGKEWNRGCGKKGCECSGCLENKTYRDKIKGKNIYKCKDEINCKFSTEESKSLLEQNLDNSDKVAAYNIAKRGL